MRAEKAKMLVESNTATNPAVPCLGRLCIGLATGLVELAATGNETWNSGFYCPMVLKAHGPGRVQDDAIVIPLGFLEYHARGCINMNKFPLWILIIDNITLRNGLMCVQHTHLANT